MTSLQSPTAAGEWDALVSHFGERERPAHAQCVPSPYFGGKHRLDRPLAALLLVVFSPLLAVLACWPGIFRQLRVGRHGRSFTMYKIRTMRRHAEAETGAVWARPNDPRLTLMGRLLRHLHLDELPQLLNVLQGEMSLVGPRPERPVFVRVLAEKVPGYLDRLVVLPGITGLAQMNLPPDSGLDSVRQKLRLDLEYIETGDLLFDVRLLTCTALRLFQLRLDRLLGVERTVSPSPGETPGSGAEDFVHPTDLSAPPAGQVRGQPVHCGSGANRGGNRRFRSRVKPR